MKPLLSICVPTYNRAHLLKEGLHYIVTEASKFEGLVEILVSDNHSTDETPQIVEGFSSIFPIRYNRHEHNLGACLNIDFLITKMANGQFCWVLGDDDILREGAVARVLDVIEKNPDIDYIFMNHSYESHANRETIPEIRKKDLSELALLCQITEDKRVDAWEDIIEFSNTPALFTSIVSSIFRTTSWKNNVIQRTNLKHDFDKLETTFPHTYILATQNIGRPAYYIGYPFVAFFVGAQDWLESWNYLVLSHVLSLSDHFQKSGAKSMMIDKYRNIIFEKTGASYLKILKIRNPKDLSIIRSHIVKYWKYPNFRKIFIYYPLQNFNFSLKFRLKSILSRCYRFPS